MPQSSSAARRPRSSTSTSAAAHAAFLFQSANTTEAPDSAKAFAIARPSPDPAPVTSATLFSYDMFITKDLLWNGLWLRLRLESFFGDRDSGHGLGPPTVKCQVGDSLDELCLRDAVLSCAFQVKRQLGVPTGDQRGDGDKTAVTLEEF